MMQYIIDKQSKTLEFLENGDLESILKVLELYPDYFYRFSGEEKSVYERLENINIADAEKLIE